MSGPERYLISISSSSCSSQSPTINVSQPLKHQYPPGKSLASVATVANILMPSQSSGGLTVPISTFLPDKHCYLHTLTRRSHRYLDIFCSQECRNQCLTRPAPLDVTAEIEGCETKKRRHKVWPSHPKFEEVPSHTRHTFFCHALFHSVAALCGFCSCGTSIP